MKIKHFTFQKNYLIDLTKVHTFPYIIKSNQIRFIQFGGHGPPNHPAGTLPPANRHSRYFFRTYFAKNIVCTTGVGHFGTRPMYSVLVSSSHAPSARAWLRLGLNTLVLAPKDLLYLLDTQYTILSLSWVIFPTDCCLHFKRTNSWCNIG